jgi:hypothetical protein
MTTLPANVTIVDLTLATTLSSAALFEAVQTTNGVVESVSVSLSQIMTTGFGGLPTGGATGQILNKASGTNFAATWSSISSFISASSTSGITISGSTSATVSLASIAGLSVLGNASTATTSPAAIVASAGAQVLRANDGNTTVAFGAINLASSAAVTGVLPGANVTAIDLSAVGAGGVQNILQATNITAINLATTGAGGVQNVLTVPNGGSGTSTLTSNALLVGAGTTKFSLVTATTAGLLLTAAGATTNPTYQPLNLASTVSFTSFLGVPQGGSGTTTFAARAVLLGGTTATSAVQVAAVQTAGRILVDQGTAVNASFQVVGGDLVLSSLGTATVTTNAITTTKFQQAAGLSALAVNSSGTANFSVIAGAAAALLRVNDAGTGVIFSALSYASGSTSRDLSTANGAQSITGVGFTPKALLVSATNQSSTIGSWSIGWASGTAPSANLSMLSLATPKTIAVQPNQLAVVAGTTDNSTNQSVLATTFDVDGFTLQWTKSGSPTGTSNLIWFAMR